MIVLGADQLDILRDSRNNEYMTQTGFQNRKITSDELLELHRKLVNANRAICDEYGNDSEMNVDLCEVYDELAEYMTDDRGLVIE